MEHTLVISPHTSRLGLAVFEGAELMYFAVKNLRHPRTKETIRTEIKTTVRQMSARFDPAMVIIRAPSRSEQISEKHQYILKTLNGITCGTPIRARLVAFDTVKLQILNKRDSTKAEIFDALAQRYTEIARYTTVQNRHQDEYYTPMLNAIAIGYACWKRRRAWSLLG